MLVNNPPVQAPPSAVGEQMGFLTVLHQDMGTFVSGVLTYPELAGLDSRGKHREPKSAKVFDAVTQDVGEPSEAHRSRPAPRSSLATAICQRHACRCSSHDEKAGGRHCAGRSTRSRRLGRCECRVFPFFFLYQSTPYSRGAASPTIRSSRLAKSEKQDRSNASLPYK